MTSDIHGPSKAAIFYAIALGLAIVLAMFCSIVLGESVAMVTMVTPVIAAVIMLLGTGEGRAGWMSLGVNRAGLNSWWLAVVGPLVILAASYGVLVTLGLARIVTPETR